MMNEKITALITTKIVEKIIEAKRDISIDIQDADIKALKGTLTDTKRFHISITSFVDRDEEEEDEDQEEEE